MANSDDFFDSFGRKPPKKRETQKLENADDWMDVVSPKKEPPKVVEKMTDEQWKKYCEDSPF